MISVLYFKSDDSIFDDVVSLYFKSEIFYKSKNKIKILPHSEFNYFYPPIKILKKKNCKKEEEEEEPLAWQ